MRWGKNGLINSDYPFWRRIKLTLCLIIEYERQNDTLRRQHERMCSEFGAKDFLAIKKPNHKGEDWWVWLYLISSTYERHNKMKRQAITAKKDSVAG